MTVEKHPIKWVEERPITPAVILGAAKLAKQNLEVGKTKDEIIAELEKRAKELAQKLKP